MRTNRARCRCGGAIFERSVDEDRWQWAHAEPFDAHDTTLCPDGLAALPMVGTQTNPRTPLAAPL